MAQRRDHRVLLLMELELTTVCVSIAFTGGSFHVENTHRYFTAQQKAEVVRRHVSGKEAVSDLADELGVQPSQIHAWVKLVLDQADKAFQRTAGNRRAEEAQDRLLEQLRAKLADKNEVIAELMEENVKAKKVLQET